MTPTARLMTLFEGQPLEGFERSFKMTSGRLLVDRTLVGINRRDVEPERLLDLCVAFGMPSAALGSFRERLPEASSIHFGFEYGGQAVHKAYLEFADRYVAAMQSGSLEPFVLHLAFKWSAPRPDEAFTVARYLCHPGIRRAAMLVRAAAAWAGAAPGPSWAAVREILARADERGRDDFMYLDVREEANPRASFDINLHPAGLAIGDVEDALLRAAEAFGIHEAFDAIRAPLRAERLGHVSAGTSRHGEDFLTVYYASCQGS